VLGELRRPNKSKQCRLWDDALKLGHVWRGRFYDFIIRSEDKKREKLRYIHRNPLSQHQHWAFIKDQNTRIRMAHPCRASAIAFVLKE